ncbi:MAG TPA: hypothetical protein VGB59_02445 [Allosphingosinicella sp.]|jgi:hypothetical protein
MSLLLALALAQASVVTSAPPSDRAVPATEWSCAFEGADSARFRLSGRLEPIPAGWDPNQSRPTQMEGEGSAALAGKASYTNQENGQDFRDYQIQVARGAETYFVNLKLRRGGAGVAYVTRYVSGKREPYSYIAAGLCTSQFDAAPQKAAQ